MSGSQGSETRRLRRGLRWLPLALLLPLAWTLSSGCSLTRSRAECASTSECREAFGTGYVCGGEGLCALARVEPQCLTQSPSDLLLAPEKYLGYVVLGSLLRTEGKEGARQDSAGLVFDAVNRFIEREEEQYTQLQGLRFGFVQCDHLGDVQETARLARYLVDVVEAPGILGPASSSGTSAAFNEVNVGPDGAERRRTLMISPSATSLALRDLETTRPGMLWRTAPTDDGQGKLMGEFAAQEQLDFIAVYEDTPYGRGLFEELQKASGGGCADCGFAFDASSSAIEPLAATLASNRALEALEAASTVFFMGAQETHLNEMIRRLEEEEFREKVLFFSDAGASADTVANIRAQDAERVIGTRPKAAEEGEALRVFESVYQARYDESPLIHSFTTNAYDAAWLLVLSALRARLSGEDITPEALAEGMTHLSDPLWSRHAERDCPSEYADEECQPITLDSTNLPALLEALQRWDTVNVQGASGNLDYDAETEELMDSSESFEFWHLQPLQDEDITYSIVGGMRDEQK